MVPKKKTKKARDKILDILEEMPKNVQNEKSKISTPDREQKEIKKNNKLLIIVLSLFGLVLLAFFTGYFLITTPSSFDYKDVKFNIIQEGNLVFYNTQIPI